MHNTLNNIVGEIIMKKSSMSKYILIGSSIILLITIGEKKVPDFVLPLIFIAAIIRELKYKKQLILSTRKSYLEVITVILTLIIFTWLMYSYAKTLIHYITGVLGILVLISNLMKEGIGTKGFMSMYRYKEIIKWNEIKKVKVIISKDIKILVFGSFMEHFFHFNKSDYDKVITILNENLDAKVEIDRIWSN